MIRYRWTRLQNGRRNINRNRKLHINDTEICEGKYGFKAHTAYIAEVKRLLGLTMYDASNATEGLKQQRKHPLKEKAEVITDALKYFEVI